MKYKIISIQNNITRNATKILIFEMLLIIKELYFPIISRKFRKSLMFEGYFCKTLVAVECFSD